MGEGQAKCRSYPTGTKTGSQGSRSVGSPVWVAQQILVLPSLLLCCPRPNMEMLHGNRDGTYNSLCRKHLGCLRVVHSILALSSRSSLAVRSRHFRDRLASRAKEKSAHCWVVSEQDTACGINGEKPFFWEDRAVTSAYYATRKTISWISISFYSSMCPTLTWIINENWSPLLLQISHCHLINTQPHLIGKKSL